MTLHDAKEWLYALVRSKKRGTILAILLLAVGALGWYLAAQQPISQIPFAKWVFPVLLPLGALLAVYLLIRPERTREGHIGIVLAIDYETEEEAQLMVNDFVREIERRLCGAISSYQFQVIVPSRFLLPSTFDRNSAERLRNLCRAHFVLQADVRTRADSGANTRAFRLEGLVCHAPIPLELSSALAHEMRSVLPPQHCVACSDDLQRFEVTSAFIACAARYVIAVAAMLSQDFEYAISLLEK